MQEIRCPPPIDEAEVWARVAGGRKRGMVYGMGVVPSHKYAPLFSDPDDDDTASGPPDLREQGDFVAGRGACSELSCCRGRLSGEGADLGVHCADAVAGGLQLEESLLKHVQLPDSDAEWRIRLRFDARHASSTATTASCSVTDSPIAA
ncbi:hypothetical protein PIB30_111893 [Stylosanthes scabra]|uniref:Uncharacterized protein n=1 Tax=Stylosanthes scabra TaxID=79078 RepID=A0ABU6ZYZ6_9FABA|nr:hypothetical protein [Stylosanthes scabra]